MSPSKVRLSSGDAPVLTAIFAGDKVCVHVHGVYPYFCVPFDPQHHVDKSNYLRKFAAELDEKLNPADQRNKNRAKSSSIHSIELIKKM